ncbi:hypothetical protein ACFY19_20785 [Streptosporangium saharense]|uniref:hypothetical protein n=1 Tax=Streptosporangium saharense TaxID=1706840 RepID=UPI00369C733F
MSSNDGEFKFSVYSADRTFYDNTGRGERARAWIVELPHQCDEWQVAQERSREAAVARMETFLAEGQAALERLRAVDSP